MQRNVKGNVDSFVIDLFTTLKALFFIQTYLFKLSKIFDFKLNMSQTMNEIGPWKSKEKSTVCMSTQILYLYCNGIFIHVNQSLVV